jgi:hypothetical protein
MEQVDNGAVDRRAHVLPRDGHTQKHLKDRVAEMGVHSGVGDE